MIILALAAAVWALPARAASSAVWTQYGAESFAAGALEGVALSDKGALQLGLRSRQVFQTSEPYLWSLALDGTTLYAGSGNKAMVFRADASGNFDEMAMLPGVGVSALAVGSKGELYAGVFPAGEVYRVDKRGKHELLAELPGRYVWALIPDARGNLLAATGAPAGIHRISPDGAVKTLMRSQERHILCMTLDENGNIYAGSSPGGLVIYLDVKSEKFSVIYDLDEEEAYRIASLGGGEVLVAANRDQMPAAPPPQPGNNPNAPQSQAGGRDEPLSFPVPYFVPQGGAPPLPSAIYRVKLNGDVRRLFTLPDPTILSLIKLDGTRFMAGTGNRGNVYILDIETRESVMHQLPVKQALAIAGDGKAQYFATGNPGAVYTFENAHNATGTYTSPVNDTFAPSVWGRLWASGDEPARTRLEFSVRSGNTGEPADGSWSDWSAPVKNLSGAVSSPPGRFVQYRASFFASDTAATPVLRQVNLAYLAANQPPRINELKVSQAPPRRQPPPQDSQDSGGAKPGRSGGGAAPPQNGNQQQQINYTVGALTANQEVVFSWKALDPDGDPLRFSLDFKPLDSGHWTQIEEKYFASEFRWLTESVPDGQYVVRLTASDLPGNPAGRARSAQKETDPFLIDNSRPEVSATANASGKTAVITGKASDRTSIISGLEYSLNNLEWLMLLPEDGIFDSLSETFRFELTDLATGSHSVIVRARDFTGNTSSAAVNFRVK